MEKDFDFLPLLRIVYVNRKKIILTTFSTTLLGFVLAVLLPQDYRVDCTIRNGQFPSLDQVIDPNEIEPLIRHSLARQVIQEMGFLTKKSQIDKFCTSNIRVKPVKGSFDFILSSEINDKDLSVAFNEKLTSLYVKRGNELKEYLSQSFVARRVFLQEQIKKMYEEIENIKKGKTSFLKGNIIQDSIPQYYSLLDKYNSDLNQLDLNFARARSFEIIRVTLPYQIGWAARRSLITMCFLLGLITSLLFILFKENKQSFKN